MTRRRTISLTAVLLAMVTALATTTPAAAEPSTTVSYGPGAAATRFKGAAFDACDAPTTTTMQAWRASPFRAVGVYIGGPNRTCSQRNLSQTWVTTVSRTG